LGDFSRNVSIAGPSCIPVGFLKQDDIRISTEKKFDDGVQFRAARDIPTDDAKAGQKFPRFSGD
jgi:hypothetical protein